MNVLYNFNPSDEASKPSFFEMFIQAQMIPSLKPALKHVFGIIAQRFPRCYWLYKYGDEVFYSGLFVLERHYLKHYDGSFSENFYGFKRTKSITGEKKSPPLSRQDKLVSIFLLVGLPYIKDKLHLYHEKLLAEAEDNVNMGWLKKLFVKVFPIISSLYEAFFFIYQLLYMYNHTDYFTPLLHAQSMVVKRLTMHDMVAQSQRENTQSRKLVGLQWLLSKGLSGWKVFLDQLKYLLPTAIFFFKFLEWWYKEDRVTPQNTIVPPPDVPKQAMGGLSVPDDKTLCPLCTEKRVNPALLPSGYCFCYTCIFDYVQLNQKCPITHMPASTEKIRKIYDESI